MAAQSLAALGIPCQVRSGGSTPSAAFAAVSVGGVGRVGDGIGGLTELRPGVYVFGDAQQVELGVCALEDVALTVVATVVSHAGGRVILDAGSKALGADRAPWATGFGRVQEAPDARIVALSEHHATVEWGAARCLRSGRACWSCPTTCAPRSTWPTSMCSRTGRAPGQSMREGATGRG